MYRWNRACGGGNVRDMEGCEPGIPGPRGVERSFAVPVPLETTRPGSPRMTPQSSDSAIVVKGAREHNLESVNITIPRNQLVCFTGVSGSGKSSLAFDTLYAEGQRRYIESLSSFARQFLGRMPKPDVDFVGGLSPSISISQKTAGKNPRSTVGTITEIYDYLRVLYARVGSGHCPKCKQPISGQSREQVVARVMQIASGTPVQILAPLIRGQKGHYRDLFADLIKQGFIRARVDGEIISLADEPQLDRRRRHDIELVVDRLTINPASRARIVEGVELALKMSGGSVVIAFGSDNAGLAEQHLASDVESPIGEENDVAFTEAAASDLRLSAHYACTDCDLSFDPPTPQLFSFNSPHGMCPSCLGLGEIYSFDPELLVEDPSQSIREGCIPILGKWKDLGRWRRCVLEGVADTVERTRNLDGGTMLDSPWQALPDELRDLWLHGTGDEHITFTWRAGKSPIKHGGTFEGFLYELSSRYGSTKGKAKRQAFEKYMRTVRCHRCRGERLCDQARAVLLTGRSDSANNGGDVSLSLPALGNLTIGEAHHFMSRLSLTSTQELIAEGLLKEIRARLGFLLDVGLEYLTLNRRAPTLSGGEAQRIRLAGQVGCALVGVLYILDEPSIGLHPRDNERLLQTLQRLRDLGNTVLVVEHDEDTMRAADQIIDFGPGAGVRGGRVVAQGSVEDVTKARRSVTGKYLSGKEAIAVPETRRPATDRLLRVTGVTHHNLKNVDVAIPLGTFVCVTGVSGSGKSSLVNDVISHALHRDLNRGAAEPGAFDRIDGLEHLDKLIAIDQSPIGRTPRSNPGTYVKVFDEIRRLFAQLPEAKRRGYAPGRFSFNVRGGRCEACEGNGASKLDMDFLADIWVTCPVCDGKRFNHETLSVTFKGHSIAEVLEMDLAEAIGLFENIPKIHDRLQTLCRVGMDYIKIGQPSPTLSGGEAQRIKLARELTKRSSGKTLYLLDEPTTGLHFADVRMLLTVLHDFVDAGNTVLVVEHNLDVVKTADWVIDLGPEGGAGGGEIVVAGTPEEVADCKRSHTGNALAPLLGRRRRKNLRRPGLVDSEQNQGAVGRQAIEVRGARQHNLRHVDVAIPRDKMTVFCGPSGSGKTSLAMDTIYAEGQRRYVESLSSYARQFVGQMQKPEIESIEGLSPAIAIEQQNLGNSPRSTVGTVTEIYDYLRILMARLGTPYCPECNVPVGSQTLDQICDKVMAYEEGTRLYVMAPIEIETGSSYALLWDRLREQGFVRIWIDGTSYSLDDPPQVDRRREHRVAVVVDRIVVRKKERSRIAESLEAGLDLGRGVIDLAIRREELDEAKWPVVRHSRKLACEECGRSFDVLTPHHFSFNSPIGWCPGCEGIGTQTGTDPAALLHNPSLTLGEGVLKLWPSLEQPMSVAMLHALARAHEVPLDVSWVRLDVHHRRVMLHGTKDQWIDVVPSDYPSDAVSPRPFRFQFKGMYRALEDVARRSPRLRQRLYSYMADVECNYCLGSRIRDDASAVRMRGVSLHQLCRLPLGEIMDLIKTWKLDRREKQIAGELLREVKNRVQFLVDVGLDYLALDRTSGTLSGGEAQRIRLARQLGSGLCGVLYVLDEPTIGLHPRDNRRLLDALYKLRDLGNTLLLVEHDKEVIAGSDALVDFGPGSGRLGGEIVASGTPADVGASDTSVTGPYLTARHAIGVPAKRRAWQHVIRLAGAQHHNLKDITVEFPLETLTVVTGPSGSGKSSLIDDTLWAALSRRFYRSMTTPGAFSKLEGVERIDKVIRVDQQPLGNSPSSNPATYTGAMEWIRELFAKLPGARQRGYTARRFSFNVPGGRCETCEGQGQKCIEMHFLPDVWIPCDACSGTRYNEETLEVKFHGHSIADVLDMSCADACRLFEEIPLLHRILTTLCDVGLDYLTLGQAAPTLSGGEAQRVKLARELSRPDTGRTLYLLDEPTTGLHFSDLEKLLDVLNRLVDLGNTVVVIEHNLDVIKSADWVIDIGPEAGANGGEVVVAGTPEEVAEYGRKHAKSGRATKRKKRLPPSYTGEALAEVIGGPRQRRKKKQNAVSPNEARSTTKALKKIAAASQAPWESDGRSWHLEQRVGRDGKPCQWDPHVLQRVIEKVERCGEMAPVNWRHRSIVEVTGHVKSHGWFLHAITADTYGLRLKFRVPSRTFKKSDLQAALSLPTWNQCEELPIYGNEPRVTCKGIGRGWQEVQILAHRLDEFPAGAFDSFLDDAVEAFASSVRHPQSDRPDNAGRVWHFTRRGFPDGADVHWDPGLLKELFQIVQLAAGQAQIEWNHEQAVHVFVNGQPAAWATLFTKMPDTIALRLVGPKGSVPVNELSRLNESAELQDVEDDNEYDVVHIRFSEKHEVRDPHFTQFLLRHRSAVVSRGTHD